MPSGGVGGRSFVACLSPLTIDHAFRSRPSTVLPTPYGDTSNTSALIMFLPYISSTRSCWSYPLLVLPSLVAVYLLGESSLYCKRRFAYFVLGWLLRLLQAYVKCGNHVILEAPFKHLLWSCPRNSCIGAKNGADWRSIYIYT